jgi:hypothetical protein
VCMLQQAQGGITCQKVQLRPWKPICLVLWAATTVPSYHTDNIAGAVTEYAHSAHSAHSAARASLYCPLRPQHTTPHKSTWSISCSSAGSDRSKTAVTLLCLNASLTHDSSTRGFIQQAQLLQQQESAGESKTGACPSKRPCDSTQRSLTQQQCDSQPSAVGTSWLQFTGRQGWGRQAKSLLQTGIATINNQWPVPGTWSILHKGSRGFSLTCCQHNNVQHQQFGQSFAKAEHPHCEHAWVTWT